MGSIGAPEILVVLLVALIVLGPKRLPEAARQAGRALAEFRRITSGFQEELRDALHVDESRAQASALEEGAPTQVTEEPTPSSNGWRRIGPGPERPSASEDPPTDTPAS